MRSSMAVISILWLTGLSALLLTDGIAADVATAVHIGKNGETVTLESEFTVPVARDIVWQVLTDFDHMATFIPNLNSSQVLERTASMLRIEQKGTVPFGLFHLAYDSIRQIDLTPMTQIHAHTIGGDSGVMNSVSTLSEKNGQTVVSYRAEWTPASRLVGSLGTDTAREQLAQQFTAMEHEMRRRGGHKHLAADASAAATP